MTLMMQLKKSQKKMLVQEKVIQRGFNSELRQMNDP